MIEKNKEYIVEIIDNGYEGEGIAKVDNFTIFIQNGIKGEKHRILIVKVLKTHGYGKSLEILKSSENRQETDCATYKQCGGCGLRHISYEETLNMKKEIVQNCIKKELGVDVGVNFTLGMGIPYYYRNKLQYPVGISRDNKSVMGIYSKRSHNIVPTKECFIQNKLSQEISKDIYEFMLKNNIEPYNEQTLKGLVRHIIVRIGVATSEIMVIIVQKSVNTKQNIEMDKKLVQYIVEKYPRNKNNCKKYK